MKKYKLILLLLLFFPIYLYSQWIPVGLGTPLGGDIEDLKLYNSNIYSGGTANLFRSSNGGDNWSSCLPGFLKYAWSITRNNYAIFCSSSNPNGIYFSTNDGISWELLPDFPSYAGAIHCLECDNNFIYAQTSIYFLKSSNNGQNWVTENNPGGFVLFHSNGRLYSAGSGLKVSTNFGANWTLLKNEAMSSFFAEDSVLFAGSQNNGLFRSGNYGQNFINVIPGNIRVNAIYKYNDYVFVHADTFYTFSYSSKNFYVSIDKGFNFIKRNQGLDSVSISSMVYYNNYIYIAVANYGTTNVAIYKRPLQEIIGIKKEQGAVPQSFSLSQNYPNPFNQSTIINFSLPLKGYVTLKVYDILGREITDLINLANNQILEPGSYSINFISDGLSSGFYFYRIYVNSTNGKGKYFSDTKRMVLVK